MLGISLASFRAEGEVVAMGYAVGLLPKTDSACVPESTLARDALHDSFTICNFASMKGISRRFAD
jgi:hypothetical protein